MAKKQTRQEIPSALAARVLFMSDRTCCVCRVGGKLVQIHHLDGNRSHNTMRNLAVLCFDCHRNTQIHGGFDRKLDADQVTLYRDDWHRIVVNQREASQTELSLSDYDNRERIELATSVAEIYRENEEFELLAKHYHNIGNLELRDKYVELAIEKEPRDGTICYLRSLQGRPELIPAEVIERESARYTANKDWLQRARFFHGLGKNREAVADYIRGIDECLKENALFSAGYYLKELVGSALVEELLVLSIEQAKEEKQLWWQIRALQELGWHSELDDILLRNAAEIEQSGDLMMLELLADAKGDKKQSFELRKYIARNTRTVVMGDEADAEDDRGVDLH